MEIFNRNKLKSKPLPEPEVIPPRRRDSVTTKRTSQAQSQSQPAWSQHPLSILAIYTVVGGCIGFAIRSLLYIAGLKDWLFTHYSSFVSFSDAFDFEGRKVAFVSLILAFSGMVYALYFAYMRLSNTYRD